VYERASSELSSTGWSFTSSVLVAGAESAASGSVCCSPSLTTNSTVREPPGLPTCWYSIERSAV
jgi:hypothetical protein